MQKSVTTSNTNLKNFEVRLANYVKPFQFFNATLRTEIHKRVEGPYQEPAILYQDVILECHMVNENEQAEKLTRIMERMPKSTRKYVFPTDFEVVSVSDKEAGWLGIKYPIEIISPNILEEPPIWTAKFRVECMANYPIFWAKNSWWMKEDAEKAQVIKQTISDKVLFFS